MAYQSLGKIYLDPAEDRLQSFSSTSAQLDRIQENQTSQGAQMTQAPPPESQDIMVRQMVADLMPLTRAQQAQQKSNKTGLYIAVGLAGAAAVGLAVYFATRSKPSPMESNRKRIGARRRRKPMRRNFSERRKAAADALRKAYESGDSRRIREAAERLRAIDLSELPR